MGTRVDVGLNSRSSDAEKPDENEESREVMAKLEE